MTLEDLLDITQPSSLDHVDISINGRRTIIRFDTLTLLALEDIGRREQLSINEICNIVSNTVGYFNNTPNDVLTNNAGAGAMDEPEDKSQGATRGPITFSTAIRAFILEYYRRLARDNTAPDNRTGDPATNADDHGLNRPGNKDGQS